VSRWTRRPGVQRALARVLAGYVRFCVRTTRWRWEGREEAELVWASGEGVVVCFWHGRLLVSLSADGEFIAQALDRLGFPAIRGSAAKKTDPAKAKGGAAAFRDALKWIRSGGAMGITPDGPRGPALVMTEGPPMLAGMSGAPALLMGLACRPCIRLKTWDHTVVPLPFGRGAVVVEGPIRVERETAAAAMEPLARVWSARLTAATERAEALLR
jgi:lysophospholipid acyltransferase (LPLAT)-like uncharacterized protein